MTNSGACVVELESTVLKTIHRDVSVSEVDAFDVVQKPFALTFKVTDKSLTRFPLSMSQTRDQAV